MGMEHWGGMMLTRVTEQSDKNLSQCHKQKMGLNPSLQGDRLETNYLSHSTVL